MQVLFPSLSFLFQLIAEPSQWQADLTKDELIQKLNTTTKSADHLNELLRESEATNAILMEQIKVSRHTRDEDSSNFYGLFLKYLSENTSL